ncbi:hypothetical protein [Variovorax sp. OV329]|uniref:hypothetical protein n=1 Tax=Variovorax sp. OV329 TaxID=1882825 RepID=UPI0008F2DB65|nr:hypothetical protein [Variovorax sp. OV329]SFM55331.1 hypothetical protein SAMN05444747_106187 [Variovorax sp. OV329]
MFTFILRIVLFVMGLMFAASLAVAVTLLATVWGLRYAWARLTGKPVDPWVMRFHPGKGFEQFRAAAARRNGPAAADVAAARARGESVSSPVVSIGRGDADVTDVRSRPLDSRS